MKKLKGFTLIELIVVIAIIGVLAAILIPAMMGWITKSRITTYNSNASEVCTQLQIVLTDMESDLGIVLKNNKLIYDGSTNTLEGDPVSGYEDIIQDRIELINQSLTDMTGVVWAAEIKDNVVQAVVLSGNSCGNVGGFPRQCPAQPNYSMPGGDIENYLQYAKDGTWPTN